VTFEDWHLWRRWPRAWGWFHIAGGINAFAFAGMLRAGWLGGELDWWLPLFAALMGALMLREGMLKLRQARRAKRQRPSIAIYDVRRAKLTIGGRTVPLREKKGGGG
jgi:hypothetical protein